LALQLPDPAVDAVQPLPRPGKGKPGIKFPKGFLETPDNAGSGGHRKEHLLHGAGLRDVARQDGTTADKAMAIKDQVKGRKGASEHLSPDFPLLAWLPSPRNRCWSGHGV